MEISKTTVGVVAAFCVAAGAGGAYLATRGGDRMTVVSEAETAADPSAAGKPDGALAVASSAPKRTVAPAPAARRLATPPVSAAAREPQARAPGTPPAPGAGASGQSSPTPWTDTPVVSTPAPEPINPPEPEPRVDAEPPAREFEELVIAADSVVGLQIETSTTSERAELEDEVIGRVTRDVRVDDIVAIPAGARAHGEVTLVERGGRLRERARLGVRFTSLVLADGTRIPIETSPIYREGDAPSRESAAKIGGGAIGGAIIGGILGGAKGAAIGGSIGAGAGTTAVLAGGRNPATLPSGTPVTIRLLEPTIVTVDKQ